MVTSDDPMGVSHLAGDYLIVGGEVNELIPLQKIYI